MKNGTSVLSIHLDQVSARSVGWPPGLLFPFKLSCHLLFGPLFPSSKIFPSITPFFNIIGPACHCGRSRLSLSSTFPIPFSLHSIGPACHCGRSRLFPSSPFPTPISPYPIGPACHCGRSRHLFPLPSPHQSFPFLQARLVIVAGPAYLFPLPSPHQPLPIL